MDNRGGARVGAGRPKGTVGAYKKVKRDKQITLMMTEEELEKLKYCAEKQGKTRTSLIVDLVDELYLTIKKI